MGVRVLRKFLTEEEALKLSRELGIKRLTVLEQKAFELRELLFGSTSTVPADLRINPYVSAALEIELRAIMAEQMEIATRLRKP